MKAKNLFWCVCLLIMIGLVLNGCAKDTAYTLSEDVMWVDMDSGDEHAPENYVHLDDQLEAASSDCLLPLDSDARIAHYAWSIKDVLIEEELLPEGMIPLTAIYFERNNVIWVNYHEGYTNPRTLVDGCYTVYIDAETGAILLITDTRGYHVLSTINN